MLPQTGAVDNAAIFSPTATTELFDAPILAQNVGQCDDGKTDVHHRHVVIKQARGTETTYTSGEETVIQEIDQAKMVW